MTVRTRFAPSPTGPFHDIGQPLVHDPNGGVIDPTEFTDGAGAPYLVWKVDGNATGQPTPIHGQPLAADGLSLAGARKTLITNDLGWEGPVVEGPWVVRRDGMYYLFYSGNSYANGSYAVGVARSTSPLDGYAKAGAPILSTDTPWIGPGHCSVVDTPSGETYMVFHAWKPGHVNGPGDQRFPLADLVFWAGGGPAGPDAPSARSRPAP